MKKIAFCLFLLSSSLPVFAQEYNVPTNVTLSTNDDYARYEKDVVAAVNWLEATPLDKQLEKRKEVNSFVMKWVSGSPNVTLTLKEGVVNFNKVNPELLMIYIGGWARFAITNARLKNNEAKCSYEGLKSVVKVYKAGLGVKKDPKVDELVVLEQKSMLETYNNKQFSKE